MAPISLPEYRPTTKAARLAAAVRKRYAKLDALGLCVYCGDARAASPTTGRSIKACARCERKRQTRRRKPATYHHVAVKGTATYDSQYQPKDLPGAVIDAIFLRAKAKQRASRWQA